MAFLLRYGRFYSSATGVVLYTEPFGLVYYGCCEPLDRRVDILREIKNLRKISISPWANVNIAAEAIQRDYVLSAKLNPVYDEFNEMLIRDEI